VLVDRGVLSLRGLYLLDAGLSLGTGLMLTLLYREARPAHPPTEGVLLLARRAVRLVFTNHSTLALFGSDHGALLPAAGPAGSARTRRGHRLSYVPLYVAGLTGGTRGALLARLNLSLVPLTGAVFALAASLVALRAIRPGA